MTRQQEKDSAAASAAADADAGRAGVRVTLGRNVAAIVAWGFVVAVVIQFYLAGIGVFRGDYASHATFGHILELISVVLLILLVIVRASRVQIGLAVALVALVVAQNVFINVRATNPELAAFHPVNAVLILVVSIILAQRTWRLGGLTGL